jgi:hypothetical protein
VVRPDRQPALPRRCRAQPPQGVHNVMKCTYLENDGFFIHVQ